MRPRRILTTREATEILDKAVQEHALAVLSVQFGDDWHTYKCRFLERDPDRRFVVLDHDCADGSAPPELQIGAYVGISFRHKSRKVMFASAVEAKGRFMVDEQRSIPAVRYRWPETLTELQRRAYYRTPTPRDVEVTANLWLGGQGARESAQQRAMAIVGGRLADLSCGGCLVRLDQPAPPEWSMDDTIGLELHLPDGREPMLLDAYFRGMRADDDDQMGAAVQFVGLELAKDGRNKLQRLARQVQAFHRQHMASGLKSRGSGQRMSFE